MNVWRKIAKPRYDEMLILFNDDFQISFSNRDTSRNAWNRHWGSFYGRYGDLIKQYEVSLSQMLNDILWPDHIQWQPPYWSDFVPNSNFNRNVSGFHRTFATGVACRQGTLTPPDTWSCPIWDLQMFFCWDYWHSIIHKTTNSLTVALIWLPTEFDSFPWFDITNSWHFPWVDLLLNLTLLIKVSMGHVQRVWHADRGRICSTCWDQSFSELVVILPDYALRISLGTFSILLVDIKTGGIFFMSVILKCIKIGKILSEKVIKKLAQYLLLCIVLHKQELKVH